MCGGEIVLVHEVDDYQADAGAGHGHKKKYQNCFQGAQSPGAHVCCPSFHQTLLRPARYYRHMENVAAELNFNCTGEP